MPMKKRKALITGASSGIGLATATRLLSSKKYQIVGVARNFLKTDLLSDKNFFPYEIDLKQTSTLPEKLSEIIKSHPDIDVLVLCAGTGIFKHLEEFSFSQIKALMDINFLSCAYISKIFLPLLKKKETSNIIFMGSSAGLKGKKEGSIYCASKFALRGFAQALREECASSNVKISVIQPDMVNTPFYDNLHFHPKDKDLHAIKADEIATVIEHILNAAAVFDEVVITPQKKAITFV